MFDGFLGILEEPSGIVVKGIAHVVKAGPVTQNWVKQQQQNWTWLHLSVMMNIWAKMKFQPASAGADDGGEVGGAQQSVLSCTHSAPEGRKSLAQI